MQRRDFLKQTGSAVCGSLLFSNALTRGFLPKSSSVGLQLYTFFSQIDADVAGTLKRIAGIGYKEIESAFSKKGGYYGMGPKEFSKLVSDLGMSWKSHHVLGAPYQRPANAKPITDANGNPIQVAPIRNLKENRQELVDEIAEAGIPYLVCASIPTKTLDETKNSIEILNKTGEACKKANIVLAYHNHTGEFDKKEGESQTAYDLFLSKLSPRHQNGTGLVLGYKSGCRPR